MYEIWLMLNIVYEIAWSIWPWLVALGLLWVWLAWASRKKPWATWRKAMPAAMALGALAGVAIFFATPLWNKSGLSEMNYWVDWANLLGIVAAWSMAGFAFAWPALSAYCWRCQGASCEVES